MRPIVYVAPVLLTALFVWVFVSSSPDGADGISRGPIDHDLGGVEASDDASTGCETPRSELPRPLEPGDGSGVDGEDAVGRAALEIVVLGADAKPVVGASVVLGLQLPQASGTTDAAGRVAWRDLKGGAYLVEVHAPPHPPLVTPARIAVRPGDDLVHELVLRASESTIAGHVVDHDDRPVAGVEVTARRYLAHPDPFELVEVEDFTPGAVTDEGGEFTVSGLVDGEYTVSARLDDFEASVVARAGATGLVVVLTREERFVYEGTVRDPEGAPIPGATVDSADATAGRVTTDAMGRFRIALASAPSDAVTVIVSRDGYSTRRVSFALADAPSRLVLERAAGYGTLSGLVRSGGSPVDGEWVEIYSPYLDVRRRAHCDEDGRYSFSDLLPGKYRVFVRPSGWYRDVTVPDFEIGAGATLDLELDPLRRARVKGRFVDASGQGLPALTLWARSDLATRYEMRVAGNAEGRFDADSLCEGTLTLSSRDGACVVTGLRVGAGTSHAGDVVLDAGDLAISGRVVDEEGAPVAGARVTVKWSLVRSDWSSRSMRKDTAREDGYFIVRGLGPGLHELHVEASGRAPVELAVDPRAPGELEILSRPAPGSPSE